MGQHLNLLARRRAKKGLTALALAVLGLWTVVLAALAIHGEWQLRQHRHLEAQMRQSVGDLKVALEKKRQEAGLADSEAMARQLDLLRGQLNAKREWMDLFQRGELGNPSGYSQWFETLATVQVEGVWVQGMDMGKGGQSVSISGKSLNADAVVRYMDRVNEAFKPMGVRFTSMEFSQDASGDAASAHPTAPLSFKIY